MDHLVCTVMLGRNTLSFRCMKRRRALHPDGAIPRCTSLISIVGDSLDMHVVLIPNVVSDTDTVAGALSLLTVETG